VTGTRLVWPRRGRGRLGALVAALAVAGCGGSTAPGGGGRVTPVGGSGKTSFPGLGHRNLGPRLPAHVSPGTALAVDMRNIGGVHPTYMRLASDATADGLQWSQWGAASTTAHGTATVRICTPSCGGGHNRSYPTTITLSGLKQCGSHRFYQRATMVLRTATGTKPWGAFVQAPC
jgi:hypothetical protein